ncbi:hypothetical protein ES703_23732 [subsurface metagenome]
MLKRADVSKRKVDDSNHNSIASVRQANYNKSYYRNILTYRYIFTRIQ